ncbi:MAG: hypothetical protein ACE5I1_02930 [bacterium]
MAFDTSQYILAGTDGMGVFRSLQPTTAISAPAALSLALPPNGAIDRQTGLTMHWNASSGA